MINYKIGKTPARSEKSLWNTDYNWVSISDMIDGKKIKSTKEMVSQKAYENIFNADISPKGTLLMSFKLTIGKVSILDVDSFHNEAIISIYPYFDNENKIRDYLFKILPLISNYGNTKNAIKGKTLNSKSINGLLIPITNLTELNKITNKINSLETIITNYGSKYMELEMLNSNYKNELKKSILQYAIQGKLVKQDPTDESAEVLINKILDEKRELIKTKQIKKENLSVIYKDSTDNQFYEKFDDGKIVNITDEIPFDIPGNWSWTRMKNILELIHYGYTASAQTNGNIKLLRITDIQDDNVIWENVPFCSISELDFKKYQLKNRDVLIARTGGTVGKSFIINGRIPNSVFASYLIRCIYNINVNIEYIKLYVNTPLYWNQIKEKLTGTGQPNINAQSLQSLLIPIPPNKEQLRIISKNEQMLNLIM